jgi:hypothetical protein
VAVSVDDMASVARRALCANVSNENAESLAATASRIDHWILVEYRGLWDRDVLGGSLLSPELKAHLRRQLRALGDARLLFVKKPERRSYGRRQLFFGTSMPGKERFFQLEFDRHDDLVELDFAAALSGEETPGLPVEHPLFVVCTHGKRDRCCAKYGRPLYDALRREATSGWVWQSTHVGGDRFAGNLVCLPQGLYFGRVGAGDVWPLLDELLDGRIYLGCYRGRSCYPFAVQAAERAVREARAVTDVDGVRFVDDSKASNPHAALAAVEGLEGAVLVAGGRSKGVDLSPLAAAIPSLAGVVAIGEAADELVSVFEGRVPVRTAGSMEDAVAAGPRAARPGAGGGRAPAGGRGGRRPPAARPAAAAPRPGHAASLRGSSEPGCFGRPSFVPMFLAWRPTRLPRRPPERRRGRAPCTAWRAQRGRDRRSRTSSRRSRHG